MAFLNSEKHQQATKEQFQGMRYSRGTELYECEFQDPAEPETASSTDVARLGEDISTQSSVFGIQDQRQFMHISSSSSQQRSLAFDLRNRREIQEKLALERRKNSEKYCNPYEEIDEQHIEINHFGTQNNKVNRVSAVPVQIDKTGTAFRVRQQRPSTPKINLLGNKNQKVQRYPAKLESIQSQLQLNSIKKLQGISPHVPLIMQKSIGQSPTQQNQIYDEAKSKLLNKIFKTNKETTDMLKNPSAPKKIKIIKVGSTQKENIQKLHLADYEELGHKMNDSFCSDEEMELEDRKPVDIFENIEEKLFQIIENEDVRDVVDLNEKFLAQQLNVKDPNDLALFEKIELRVDTRFHNLQLTGEILQSIEYLKLTDSIIQTFRDIGTSFRNVRVLHLARCELKELQGFQAFEQLEELYISYNQIDELFDVAFAEHLRVLDFEGNTIRDYDQLYYLKRCQRLTNVNLKNNPVAQGKQNTISACIDFSSETPSWQRRQEYYKLIQQNVPNIQELDDESVGQSVIDFFSQKIDQCKQEQQIDNKKYFDFDLGKRFLKFFGPDSEQTIGSLIGDQIDIINNDLPDVDILVELIRNSGSEEKASRDFLQQTEFFGLNSDDEDEFSRQNSDDNMPLEQKTVLKNTENQISYVKPQSSKQEELMRQSTKQFFKEAFGKSDFHRKESVSFYTSNLKNEDLNKQDNANANDNNDDENNLMVGAPASLLRNRRQERRVNPINQDLNASTIGFNQTQSKFRSTFLQQKENLNPTNIDKIRNESPLEVAKNLIEIVNKFKENVWSEQREARLQKQYETRQLKRQNSLGSSQYGGFGRMSDKAAQILAEKGKYKQRQQSICNSTNQSEIDQITQMQSSFANLRTSSKISMRRIRVGERKNSNVSLNRVSDSVKSLNKFEDEDFKQESELVIGGHKPKLHGVLAISSDAPKKIKLLSGSLQKAKIKIGNVTTSSSMKQEGNQINKVIKRENIVFSGGQADTNI